MRSSISTLAFLSLVVSVAQSHLRAYGPEKMPLRQGPTLMLQTGHSDCAYTMSVSKDGKWLVTAGHDGTPTLWETATGREVRTFIGHRDFINAMVFSDDGKRLATCSGQGVLEFDEANGTIHLLDASTRLWDVATGQQLQTFKHSGKVMCLSMSSDGKLLATGGSDHRACVWNTATGALLHAFRHPAIEDGRVTAVAMSTGYTLSTTTGVLVAAAAGERQAGLALERVRRGIRVMDDDDEVVDPDEHPRSVRPEPCGGQPVPAAPGPLMHVRLRTAGRMRNSGPEPDARALGCAGRGPI